MRQGQYGIIRRMMTGKSLRICLTGGIACGKSLVAHNLHELGVETIDADDIVHEIIPDPIKRRRIAAEVFSDPIKRHALEAKIHPIVRKRIDEFLDQGPLTLDSRLRLAIIPLLFETQWDASYDIICCVASKRETQISRMMTTRNYTHDQAEARLAAQMPVEEKARRSNYVICNDGTVEELKAATQRFVVWLSQHT